MTDAPAPECHTVSTGSQVQPLLRQRMLNRAATLAEGMHRPSTPLSRRRSSLVSEYSDTRPSFRASTDSLLRPGSVNDMDKLTSADETSFWHSAPLAFAILPAVGGLLFQNGGAVVTDILLLAFSSMFLHWCVTVPWDWYRSAQQIVYEPEEPPFVDTIREGDEGSEGVRDDEDRKSLEATPSEAPTNVDKDETPRPTAAQEAARKDLGREELLALAACFLAPLLGAYLLHAIRSQLSRPAEGLVSNYNLTIFVMAAELRPVSHMIKMQRARMLHLQRIVRADRRDGLDKVGMQALSQRLSDLEEHVADPSRNTDVEAEKHSAAFRQSVQTQLNDLNRAVRRYEKKATVQSIHTEARFHDLDTRLQDALSLAAAAARCGQRPGVISMLFTWLTGSFTFVLDTSWAVATYPFRTLATLVAQVQAWLPWSPKPVLPQPRKRTKPQSSAHQTMSASRIQSRNER